MNNENITSIFHRKIVRMSPEEAKKKYRLLCVFHNWTDRLGFAGDEYAVVRVDKN